MELIDKTISHYKILEKLGSGGMGSVYKAEDLRLHRTVALKFLPLELTRDEESKQRFINEAHAASSLQHHNVCTIHDIDETDDGKMFICMDCYEGETLREKISKGPLNISEITNIIIQIAEGLKKAHENGIVHRDIKPANIFITKDGIVKILDFGIAKLIGQALLTQTGRTMGTIAYLSPEQAKGEHIDHRTDIWSLGVMLYEMLSGEKPFKGEYDQVVIFNILNEEPENIKKFRKDIPSNLFAVLEKSLEKDRGYRYEYISSLLEDLKHLKDEAEIQPSQINLISTKPSQSVVVLPFVNLSGDPEQEYFCDGLAEELINSLSKISDIKVVARTSAFAFKGSNIEVRKIGKRLNVGTVLEGSVRKVGNRIRIMAQLINVRDGYHLWSEKYDREFNDVFNVQDEISLAIVDKLKVKLLGNEKGNLLKRYTQNPEAYDLYLKGHHIYYQYNFKITNQAIEYFHKALEKDPNYALAYVGLAECYGSMAYWGVKRPSEVLPIDRKYTQKALEIDKNLSEVYTLIADTSHMFDWKWSETEQIYLHSLELNPNNIDSLNDYGLYLCSVRRFEDARKAFERAKNIDPLNYMTFCVLFPDFCNSRFDLIIADLSKFMDLDPPFWPGLWLLWRTLSLMENKAEALEAFKKLFLLRGMNDVVKLMEGLSYEEALRVGARSLAEFYKHQYTSPYDIAMYFIHSGEKEEAIAWLETAVKEHDGRLYFLNCDPDWKSIDSDERFINCLRQIGFRT
jgi:serine/threonine protein kinase/Tfp pilus assembly protein PilF